MTRLLAAALALILAAGAAAVSPAWAGSADTAIELSWRDLIPSDGESVVGKILREQFGAEADGLLGVVPHGGDTGGGGDGALVDKYDGKTVRLPGYMVPLNYDGDGSSVFLLVPFVGACVHVPPPPPNQIVLVEADAPYPVKDYFEPVIVTGPFSRFEAETDLAEVGYRIEGRKVEPYAAAE